MLIATDYLEEPVLHSERESYMKVRGMGGAREQMSPEITLLVYAQQFRPFRVAGKNYLRSYCAYAGEALPLNVSVNTGLPKMSGGQIMHVDHIIPRGHNGLDDVSNYQGLSKSYNEVGNKGAKKTMHVVWQAFRQGQTIDGIAFQPLAENFLWVFDRWAAGSKICDVPLCSWFPWWNRNPAPPHRPIFWGYDEARKEMRVSPEESLRMEFSVLAWNVLLYCKYTTPECRNQVQETYEREYGCTATEMIKFARI